MPFTLRLTSKAKTQLAKLDSKTARRISAKLFWLAEHGASIKHEALAGDLIGAFKLRVGDYRAIYRVNEDLRVILVEKIGHRRDVYKR